MKTKVTPSSTSSKVLQLSIIIPVYNEEKTVKQVLQKVYNLKIPSVKKDIIVINDGSTDATSSIISEVLKDMSDVQFIDKKINEGKGAAVEAGLRRAKGEYIIIQDADLEYNPDDIPSLLEPIQKNIADVIFGTRLNRLPNFTRDERTLRFFIHYLGNRMLSLLTSILYGQWITDMETCYKVFPKSSVDGITLRAKGFEFEPEITTLLMKKGYSIHEVNISTNPRGYEEGKKLNTIKDGIKAVSSLIFFRFKH